jgi:hypothetical protein
LTLADANLFLPRVKDVNSAGRAFIADRRYQNSPVAIFNPARTHPFSPTLRRKSGKHSGF